jgi:FkbM family methyltransferase
VYLLGIWEPDITAYVRRQLSEGDTFVDVGAHVGYFTVMASGLVGKKGRVVSIEPCPPNLAALRANLELDNRGDNVRVLPMAASRKPGTLDLYSGRPWASDRATTMANLNYPLAARVEAAPLDDILVPEEVRSARLIKIDVEGGELDVIAGMSRLIAGCRQDAEFIIELTPGWWTGPDKSLEHALQSFLNAGFFPYQIDNFYQPWRYLWAASTHPPRRIRSQWPPMKQYVVVLSRRDVEEL